MLNFTGTLKVYVATEVADLRKSFTGLWALTMNTLKEDPRSGALFVYCNRRRNRGGKGERGQEQPTRLRSSR